MESPVLPNRKFLEPKLDCFNATLVLWYGKALATISCCTKGERGTWMNFPYVLSAVVCTFVLGTDKEI